MAMLRSQAAQLRRGLTAASAPSSSLLRQSLQASVTRRQASTSSSSSHDDQATHESFGTPFWRNIFILTAGAVVVYRFSLIHAEPHPSRASSSGRSAPGNESEDDHRDEVQGDNRPFLTRYIENWMTPSDVLKQRSEKHLAFSKERAEDKLFFQDAERPPVHRLRFPQTFQQSSPHSRPVGAGADLSDLKIKRNDE
ncbi:unnamed protein product [Parajaminaea phylloscopi]